MHLKNPLLFGLMAILLLAGTITPGISQSSFDSKILINEVETNPTGSDVSEFVELYNPTSIDIDVSGWTISPSATWKSLEIPEGTIIESDSFAAFTHVNFWFKDFGETVTLRDASGNLIDETPLIEDFENNNFSWQRTTDGFDTDSTSDWELKRMTPKSSNGKLVEIEESIFSLFATLGDTQYVFNETVTIAGTVSEELFTSLSTPEMVKINIQGPNYFKNLALFPDRDLGFSATLNLQKVLGFKQGSYDVKVSYGEYASELNFTLSNEDTSSVSESKKDNLEISTDKESYIPGETVIIFADTNSSIQYGGLDYTVTNPNQEIIFKGTIFPNERFSTVFQHGGGELYEFSTQIFMETVNPVYGVYTIEGTYQSQNPRYHVAEDVISANASFLVSEDVKEDVLISISTDKEIYSVGDTIKITGRSNDIWVEDLELRVVQTGVLSSAAIGADARYLAPDPFDLRDSVRLNGDGTFEYEFNLVENASSDENYAKSFGDYKVVVSEYFGDGITYFKVVEDPESFVDVRTPLGLKIDKSNYVLGSGLSLTGKILDYHQAEISNNMRNSVEITFADSNGSTIMFADHGGATEGSEKCNTNNCAEFNKPLKFTAYPDSVGGYAMDVVLLPLQFDYGTYTINAVHPLSNTAESISFEIKSAQSDIIPEIETKEPLTMQICKSNRAHVDEILKDLKSIGKGEIAPSMESVVCGDNLSFEVGDKLVVVGTVIQKTGIELDQSSTRTSAQTQGGSSYATNFAQAQFNYVEVSIPYPRSMTISGAASVQTVPDEDENYTGGGGSGEGSGYYYDEDGNVTRGNIDKKTSRTDDAKTTGYDGTIIMKKQKLLLTDMRYKAYPDDAGNYATVFE